MKELSCGFIIIDPKELRILGCHPTGHGKVFDIPKGHIEDGETPLQCAIRELKEETGIIVSPLDKTIIDCGQRAYNPKKDLHIFICFKKVNIKGLRCSTLVGNPDSKNYGKLEVDGYDFITDIKFFYKNLQPVIRDCLKEHFEFDFFD